MASLYRDVFRDWKKNVVDIIAQVGKVVTNYHSAGTEPGHRDVYSTGNKVDIYDASIHRLQDSKIVEQCSFLG